MQSFLATQHAARELQTALSPANSENCLIRVNTTAYARAPLSSLRCSVARHARSAAQNQRHTHTHTLQTGHIRQKAATARPFTKASLTPTVN